MSKQGRDKDEAFDYYDWYFPYEDREIVKFQAVYRHHLRVEVGTAYTNAAAVRLFDCLK